MMRNSSSLRFVMIACAAALLIFGVNAGSDGMFKSHDGRKVLIVAHRGVNKFAPENTIPAIEKAIEMKLDFVELDVRTCKDGTLVLMHDATVERTTDGTGTIRDMTLEEIKKLDAGARFRPMTATRNIKSFKGTPVPTFEEALRFINGRINVYLDWKDASPEALAKALKKTGAVNSVLALGSPAELLLLRKTLPGARTMVDMSSEAEMEALTRSKLAYDATSPAGHSFTEKMAELAHAAGAKVFVDIQQPYETCALVKDAMAKGADAVQTDNPDTILKCLERMKKSDEEAGK